MASIVDYIALDENDEARYREIITACAERKANAPKAPRGPRAPKSLEEKLAASEARTAKLRALLEAAKAKQD